MGRVVGGRDGVQPWDRPQALLGDRNGRGGGERGIPPPPSDMYIAELPRGWGLCAPASPAYMSGVPLGAPPPPPPHTARPSGGTNPVAQQHKGITIPRSRPPPVPTRLPLLLLPLPPSPGRPQQLFWCRLQLRHCTVALQSTPGDHVPPEHTRQPPGAGTTACGCLGPSPPAYGGGGCAAVVCSPAPPPSPLSKQRPCGQSVDSL